jgi:hypothetical protein
MIAEDFLNQFVLTDYRKLHLIGELSRYLITTPRHTCSGCLSRNYPVFSIISSVQAVPLVYPFLFTGLTTMRVIHSE